MLLVLGLLAVLELGVIGLMIRGLYCAPIAYEDHRGFHFARSTVPVLEAADEHGVQKTALPSTSAHKHLKILVVDDQPDICHLLSACLEQDEHTVVAAENGSEALEKFRHEAFDLVITDRRMPQMNGDQLASAIRSIKPSEPIILMTGFSETNASPDIDLLIKKPFSLHGIREAIGMVMAA